MSCQHLSLSAHRTCTWDWGGLGEGFGCLVCAHPQLQGDVGEHQPPHLCAQDPSFCPGRAALQTARALSSFDVLPSRPACTSQGTKLQPPAPPPHSGGFIEADLLMKTRAQRPRDRGFIYSPEPFPELSLLIYTRRRWMQPCHGAGHISW